MFGNPDHYNQVYVDAYAYNSALGIPENSVPHKQRSLSMKEESDGDYQELTHEQLEKIYTWIDKAPLQRPKKNIQRDFSDCVQLAKIISFYLHPS